MSDDGDEKTQTEPVKVERSGNISRANTSSSLFSTAVRDVHTPPELAGAPPEEKKRAKVKGLFDFTDKDAMKERVRLALLKPPAYSVEGFYGTSRWSDLAKHPLFENITLAVIALNAVYMAVDTDWNDQDFIADAHVAFQFMEHSFCVYFTGELFVRFMAFRDWRNCWRDGWFVFDSTLVLMMVIETWILLIVSKVSGSTGGNPLGQAAILRLFRLLRLSRLVRMLRSLPELMILIRGMMAAMRSVIYVMVLLLILTYVFAIAFTQLSEGTEMKKDFFEHVALSMYSLLIYATFLDDLSYFCDSVRAESPVCMVLVLVFITLACLTLMNMLVGVLCQVVDGVAQQEREERLTSSVKEKLQSIVDRLDTDSNGSLSFAEFAHIMEHKEAVQVLEEVGVDPASIIDFAEEIFFEDGQPVELPFDKFMEMVLDLRGSNAATVKDIKSLWKQINQKVSQTNSEVQDLRAELDQRTARLDRQVGEILDEVRKIGSALASPSSTSNRSIRWQNRHFNVKGENWH